MEDRYYSTGQAATELGVSQAQIRALCESGAIETEVTTGGQWRISKSVLDRLKAEGLPAIPRPLPGAGRRSSSSAGSNGHPALYAEPSEKVVDAAEEVVVLANEVKALGLRKQKEEALDWFRDREAEERADQRQREMEERSLLAEERVRRAREEWLQSWESWGLGRLPYDASPELRLKAHEAIRNRLAKLDPIP
jgi:excisionase family DNA binding protein